MMRPLLATLVLLGLAGLLPAQYKGCNHGLHSEGVSAPPRPEGEGEGPFEKLILRGATVIDGS